MDDFNENYISCNYLITFCFFNFPNICFNSLIVPRDYLLFFKYIRSPMTQLYSWAIPDEDALNEIKQHSPIVEIGCGSGYLHEMKYYCNEFFTSVRYWASLLKSRGTEVVALDLFPPTAGTNPSHKTAHTEIQYRVLHLCLRKNLISLRYGVPKDLSNYSNYTLLLCWPDDYHTDNKQMYTFAADCLEYPNGNYHCTSFDFQHTF